MQDSKLKFLTLLSFKLSAVKWVLWLRSNTSKAGARVIPGHELRSHMPHRAMKKGGGGQGAKIYHSLIKEIVFIKHPADAEAQ